VYLQECAGKIKTTGFNVQLSISSSYYSYRGQERDMKKESLEFIVTKVERLTTLGKKQ
jgi:hypothetical protein